MGLSVSDAVRLFLHRVVAEQALPLELKVPNAETQAAIAESRAMIKARRARFESADALFDDLEKSAASKRAADYTKTFRKDWERLTHSGRYDIGRLKEAMLLLISNDAPLGPEWMDHALKGECSDHRECHMGGDFLLIYQLEGHRINFVRAGTHAELFGE